MENIVTRIKYCLLSLILLYFGLSFPILATSETKNNPKINIKISGVNNTLNKLISVNIKETAVNQPINSDDTDYINSIVANILEANGYYDAVIVTKIKPNSDIKNPTNIKIKINLNKAIYTRNININVIDSPDNFEISDKSKLNKAITEYKNNSLNKQLDQTAYEQFKEDLIQLAHDCGYLDAEYQSHKIYIDKNNNAATVEISLDLNTLYYLNKITVYNNSSGDQQPNDEYNNDFIFKFIPYKFIKIDSNIIEMINTPYNSSDILDIQNNINNYYNNVNIETNLDTVNHVINLNITVQDAKNYLYNLGLGYSTDEGARTFGSLKIRNITDYKHKLELQGKLAQFKDLLEINYILPGVQPSTDDISLGYQFRSDKKRTERNMETERHQLLGQYQRSVNFDTSSLLFATGASFRQEKYINFTTSKSRISQLLVPFINYDHVFTADRLKTYQGTHINLMLEAADSGILSDTSFVRLHATSKSIIPLEFTDGLDGLRLIIKGQFGQVWHKVEDKIPPTLRFFAGGTNTVRGYRYDSLGPRQLNRKGKPTIVGGDRLVVMSAELEKTIYKDWSAALFYDTGNAYDTWQKWTNNLKSGAGAGIRWQSPLGKVRFDIASALDKDSDPWRIDFSFGPDL